MKNYKDLGIYDFSDYAEEITGDDLFKVNGGAQVANTNQGVANAKVGDTVTRNDGTTVTITQGDINWAQQQIDSSGSSGNNAQQQGPGSSGSGYNPGGASETEKKEETPAVQAQKNWTYNPNEPDSDKRFNAKDFNGLHIMTISCDDKENFEDFASYYTTIGQNGAAGTTVYDGIGLTDKDGNIIHVLKEEKSVENYARSVENKEVLQLTRKENTQNLFNWLDNISTTSGFGNKLLNGVINTMDESSIRNNLIKTSGKLGKISSVTGFLSIAYDGYEFIKQPNFSNAVEVGIDGISFVNPGLGLGLGITKNVSEECVKNVKELSYQEKKYLKQDILGKFNLNYQAQLFSEPSYLFMKEINYTLKSFFLGDAQ